MDPNARRAGWTRRHLITAGLGIATLASATDVSLQPSRLLGRWQAAGDVTLASWNFTSEPSAATRRSFVEQFSALRLRFDADTLYVEEQGQVRSYRYTVVAGDHRSITIEIAEPEGRYREQYFFEGHLMSKAVTMLDGRQNFEFFRRL